MSKGKELAFGIDLGTTNSAISVVLNGVPTMVGKPMPSCVMWEEEGLVVGERAYENRHKAVYSVKRHMGTNQGFSLGNKEYSATEVSAMILNELKERAEVQYGKGNVRKVTITVPAYFNDTQKRETRRAGELAGLEVVRIINEPTAASLAYVQEDLTVSENVLVFDLGGGTFDVNLVKMIRSGNTEFPLLDLASQDKDSDQITVQIMSTDGDSKLGGDDFDRELLKIALKKMGKSEEDLDEESVEKIIHGVEQIKKSSTGSVMVAGVYISPEDLASGFQKVWSRALAVTRSCIDSSKEKRFSKIVLVGGSTKFRLVTEYLQLEFPRCKVYNGLNPDESVCLGASVQTWLSMGGESSMSVFDVIPLPIGLKVDKYVRGRRISDRFDACIYKDTPIPVRVKRELFSLYDGSQSFSVDVHQGFSRSALENDYIGKIVVPFEQGLEQGERVGISCELYVDVNGVLSVNVEYAGETYSKAFESVTGASSLRAEGEPHATAREADGSPLDIKRYRRWKDNLNVWFMSNQERDELEDLIENWKRQGFPKDLASEIVSKSKIYMRRKEGDEDESEETNYFG